LRILFLSINYWPDETGIAAFNIWRCEYLASRGHQVTICTGPPYYPQWRVPDAYRGKFFQTETRNGVTILRSWMFVPQRLSTKKRILHEASFLASSFVRALGARKPDLIFVVSPPLGLGLTAAMLGRMWHVPFIFDVEDLQPDAAVELGMLRGRSILKVLYGIERMAYDHAALVSSITEGMRQRIVQKGIDPAKVLLFPPRADSSLYDVRQRRDADAFRERYGLRGKTVISHSGNMGVKQGLGIVLEVAGQSREMRQWHFLFVGDGAMRAELEQQARSRNLDNVSFLPVLEKVEFEQMLASTDIALITQQQSVSDIVFPSKTVTLLSAGCPVIASVNRGSEVARVIQSSGAGVVVEPEDAGALSRAIQELSADAGLRARMSGCGRAFAEASWDERRTLPAMEEELLRCVRRRARGTGPDARE
jgi:colanic acid biosynthesis glycosyl transferase WcaI